MTRIVVPDVTTKSSMKQSRVSSCMVFAGVWAMMPSAACESPPSKCADRGEAYAGARCVGSQTSRPVGNVNCHSPSCPMVATTAKHATTKCRTVLPGSTAMTQCQLPFATISTILACIAQSRSAGFLTRAIRSDVSDGTCRHSQGADHDDAGENA